MAITSTSANGDRAQSSCAGILCQGLHVFRRQYACVVCQGALRSVTSHCYITSGLQEQSLPVRAAVLADCVAALPRSTTSGGGTQS